MKSKKIIYFILTCFSFFSSTSTGTAYALGKNIETSLHCGRSLLEIDEDDNELLPWLEEDLKEGDIFLFMENFQMEIPSNEGDPCTDRFQERDDSLIPSVEKVPNMQFRGEYGF